MPLQVCHYQNKNMTYPQGKEVENAKDTLIFAAMTARIPIDITVPACRNKRKRSIVANAKPHASSSSTLHCLLFRTAQQAQREYLTTYSAVLMARKRFLLPPPSS
jgi:hypothetical protein